MNLAIEVVGVRNGARLKGTSVNQGQTYLLSSTLSSFGDDSTSGT